MCTNFGDPRSRDRELRHKKTLKKRQFLAWKVINSLTTPKPLDAQSWNLYTMRVLINGLRKLSLGTLGLVTKILQAQDGQKVHDFDPIYLGNYRRW